MTPIFAQSDWTVPAGYAAWVGCAAFTLLLFNQGFKAWRNLQGKPLASDVRDEARLTYALQEDFKEQKDHCTKRHGELFQGIEDVEKGVKAVVDQKIEVVRRDVEAVGRDVSALQAVNKLQSERMASMDAKLDRLIERKHDA